MATVMVAASLPDGYGYEKRSVCGGPAASPPSSRESRYRGKGKIRERIKRNRDMIERSGEAGWYSF
jgi:hypothetical protein